MSTLTSFIAAPTRDFDGVTDGLVNRLKALLARKPATKADDIGAFIQENGGVLTDQLERDISRRFGRMAG